MSGRCGEAREPHSAFSRDGITNGVGPGAAAWRRPGPGYSKGQCGDRLGLPVAAKGPERMERETLVVAYHHCPSKRLVDSSFRILQVYRVILAEVLQPAPKVGQTVKQYAAGLLIVGNKGYVRSRR